LRTAIASRAVIEQATGTIVGRLRCGADEALDRLGPGSRRAVARGEDGPHPALAGGTVAHLRVDFHSEVLRLSTSMTVILPQATTHQIGMTGTARPDDPPVLWLLHGLSDDDTIWVRRTSIERYVAPLGLAVIMPQVHRSFYADEALGGAYWTFIAEELPQIVHSFFRLSQVREDTFVAGLSMGGFGAFKLALHQPDRFAAAASLSGALDLAALDLSHQEGPHAPGAFARRVFGGDVARTDNDLVHLLEQADPAALPALYAYAGSEDEAVWEGNLRFRVAAARLGIPLTTDFGPGTHEWSYWDDKIQDVLAWLPLKALNAGGVRRDVEWLGR
jgi:S-formylglutathione hydrolase FrmB